MSASPSCLRSRWLRGKQRATVQWGLAQSCIGTAHINWKCNPTYTGQFNALLLGYLELSFHGDNECPKVLSSLTLNLYMVGPVGPIEFTSWGLDSGGKFVCNPCGLITISSQASIQNSQIHLQKVLQKVRLYIDLLIYRHVKKNIYRLNVKTIYISWHLETHRDSLWDMFLIWSDAIDFAVGHPDCLCRLRCCGQQCSRCCKRCGPGEKNEMFEIWVEIWMLVKRYSKFWVWLTFHFFTTQVTPTSTVGCRQRSLI